MSQDIRKKIEGLIVEYYKTKKDSFVPGKTTVPYALAIYDDKEVNAVVGSLLSGWLGMGANANEFERKFADFLGVRNSILTNSGSSANLLAVMSLKLPSGSEAITPAVTFPTTLNPALQGGMKPVFLDVDATTYNIDASQIEKAITSKTRLILLPHTLGNPNEMDVIMEVAEKHDLYVIEDTCDALGSKYDGKYLSTFGDFGSFSFYPAHHMTLGEGGAVVSNDDELLLTAKSLRDWGRACVCPVCVLTNPNAHCPLRFSDSPLENYDKRFTYTNIGYNLKPLDLQAAFGLQQLNRLPGFISKRKENFKKIYEELERYEDYFVLPESLPRADTCWFAFPLTVKEKSPFTRNDVVKYFEDNKVATRPLFAGNILRQPAYSKIEYSIHGKLTNSDRIMEGSFFFGVHPAITDEMISYVSETFRNFIKKVI
jgi:CDP-6-deoxy-D-xylo-4-hexulose-3-dehydrase